METPSQKPTDKSSSFYKQAIDEKQKQKLDFESAKAMEGLDDDITLLRLEIFAILQRDPDNTRLFIKTLGTLCTLVRARHDINKGNHNDLSAAFRNGIHNNAVPVGAVRLKEKSE